jgi:flagellar basal-body rod protein FlgF
MLRGIYSAASGMLSQGILSDVLADNLANINTIGFKKTAMAFQDFGRVMVNSLQKDDENAIGEYSLSVKPQGTRILFQQGTLSETGNPYHVALEGEGFFEVSVENGEKAYTRDGRFRTDNDGFLVTAEGNRLSGEQGEIQIPKNASSVVISQTGDVKVKASGKGTLESIGRLKIVQFDNNNALTKLGNSLYSANGIEPKDGLSNVQVIQGVLEQSNVNPVRELVDSMMGLRAYETLQKSINMQNDSLGKAVNEVGRVI